eukprot:TRINITY_DN10178_c0_g1_i1.p1 TRINITY_DN10178_c0_g1~~TRINITY_DN10178_c0_g1_i1.p1  ORF type:complete len:267 (-),score=51.67 TRINITY_DN10178_c0_g1_i1:162-962(-)
MTHRVLVTEGESIIARTVAAHLVQQPQFVVETAVSDLVNAERLPRIDGVENVCLAYEDAQSLTDAFTGIEDVLLIPTSRQRVSHAMAIINACKDCGVKFIVFLSSILVGDPLCQHMKHVQQCAEIERYLEQSGLAHCVLRCTLTVENLVGNRCLVATPPRDPETLVNYCTASDVGHAVDAIFTEPSAHAMQVIRLTGPDLITHEELTRYASEQSQSLVYQQEGASEPSNWLRPHELASADVDMTCELLEAAECGKLAFVSEDLAYL